MGPNSAFSALPLRAAIRNCAAWIATVLIALLVLPPQALAKAKPLDAATVHARILKRGIGNPVGVEMNSGVELVGRTIGINTDSFTIQLFNDPRPVTVNYADVIDLRTGPTRGFWIATGVGIAAVAGMAIWGFVHVHDMQQQKLPNMPIVPAVP